MVMGLFAGAMLLMSALTWAAIRRDSWDVAIFTAVGAAACLAVAVDLLG